MAEPDSSPPKHRWPLVPLAGLFLAAVAICLYLTRFHEVTMYGDKSATLSNCPQTETTNCEVVNTSEYSEILGVPISALGVPVYLLLFWLTARGWRRGRVLGWVFMAGLLLVSYSGYLFYVSKVEIGYLCAWCFRLYMINAAVPVLALLAAGRNPLSILRELTSDLARPPRELRMAAGVAALLFVIAILGDLAYRGTLTRSAGGSPATAAAATRPPLPEAAVEKKIPFQPTATLEELTTEAGKVRTRPFDLRGHLGHGRPVALIYWSAGDTLAEQTLVALSHFLRESTPRIEVLAVAGHDASQRLEMLWESYCLLDVPSDLPLLVDDKFALLKELGMTDVPNLALFEGDGVLVTPSIKGLKQIIRLASGHTTGEQLLEAVASGSSPELVQQLSPYYPSSQMLGECAPRFTLPELTGGRDFSFSGRSRNGKPTLLIFWSSTCKHCQKEIPNLLTYFGTHPDEFNVVSVSIIKPDQPDGFSHRRVTEAYVKSHDIRWPVLDDSSLFASNLYKVTTTPTTFVISPGGGIADIWYYVHEDLPGAMQQEVAQLARLTGECRAAPKEPARRASFSMQTLDGRAVPLNSVTDRPGIVHLWATWCAPCQAELPGLLKFRDLLEKRGGRVTLVSVEDAGAAGKVREFGSRLGPNFDSYLAPREGLAGRLDLSYSLPRSFLIGRDGSILRIYHGAQPWSDPAFEKGVLTLLQLSGG